mgnify:CR=1 FL=1
MNKMIERYSTPTELDYYEKLVRLGLESEELQAAFAAFKLFQGSPTALVVGCGAGRESFALEKMGYKVLGIDSSQSMIMRAQMVSSRIKSRVTFKQGDVFSLSNAHFDFLFVSPAIIGHIPTQTKRVEFLKKLHQLGNQNSVLFCLPYIRQLTPRDRLFWGSQILRFRWRGQNIWSPGDTVSSFLGNHNTDAGLLYYHFYPSFDHFERELRLAGFLAQTSSEKYSFTRADVVSII